MLISILWGVKQGRIKFTMPPMKLYLPFLAICLLSALSLMYTNALGEGTNKLFRFAIIAGLIFFGSFYLLGDKRRLRNFMIIFIIFALVIVVDVFQGGPQTGDEVVKLSLTSNYLMTGAIMVQAFMMVLPYFHDRQVIVRRGSDISW